MISRFKYFENERYFDQTSATAGTKWWMGSYWYSGNSMFNPNAQTAASGEHQPAGFDEWSRFFSQYRVFASKIRVTFKSNSADTAGWHMAVMPAVSGDYLAGLVGPTASAVQIQGWKENNLIHHKQGICQYATGGRVGDSDTTKTVTYFQTTNRMFATEDDVTYIAAINASPANQWYWGIALWNRSRSDSFPLIGIMSVRIVYYAEMFNPIQWNLSLIGDETEDTADENSDPIVPWVPPE